MTNKSDTENETSARKEKSPRIKAELSLGEESIGDSTLSPTGKSGRREKKKDLKDSPVKVFPTLVTNPFNVPVEGKRKMSYKDLKKAKLSIESHNLSLKLSSTLELKDKLHLSTSSDTIVSKTEHEFFCDWYPVMFQIEDEAVEEEEEESEGKLEKDEYECLYEEVKSYLGDDFEDTEAEEEGPVTKDEDEVVEREKRVTLLDVPEEEEEEEEKTLGGEYEVEEEERELTFHEIWLKNRNRKPVYGRKAIRIPVLERPDKKSLFKCTCDIERDFTRKYIRRFGDGTNLEKKKLDVHAFLSSWPDFLNIEDADDLKTLKKIFRDKHDEDLRDRRLLRFQGLSKGEIKKFREQILQNLRPLDCREIRRYRMPYVEAIYLELQEDLYIDSASYFKHLLIKDLVVNKESNKTKLKDDIPLINQLVSFLKIAEKFSKLGKYNKEVVLLLKSGKHFNDLGEGYWWLSGDLFQRAVDVSLKITTDSKKSEALARYILGTFLLDCVYDVQAAQEHLYKARELSYGQNWNAGKIVNKVQDSVYKECTGTLCRALIDASTELRKKGKPEEALPLIHRSHKLCEDSKAARMDVTMCTYFELGKTYQALDMLNWAKAAFKKFIDFAKIEGISKSVCDGYLELAICCRMMGDYVRCHQSLTNYLETARAAKDSNLMAFGYRYLGEFHLNNGDSHKAAEILEKAFNGFHKQCMASLDIPVDEWKPEFFTLSHDVELVRTLAGLARGELLTRLICSLILRTRTRRNDRELQRLIMWKNTGEINFDTIEVKVDDHSLYDEHDFSPEPDSINSESSSDSDSKDLTESKSVRFASKEVREMFR